MRIITSLLCMEEWISVLKLARTNEIIINIHWKLRKIVYQAVIVA
jgi:hypothetical protein